MLTRAHSPLLVAAVLLSTGCASSGESSGAGRSRNLITADELMAVPHNTTYEAVRALRPRWLLPRTVASLRNQQRHTPRVYVDGQLRGEIEELRRLAPHEVEEIRYMSASDATTRFGTNHIAGAIVVSTWRG